MGKSIKKRVLAPPPVAVVLPPPVVEAPVIEEPVVVQQPVVTVEEEKKDEPAVTATIKDELIDPVHQPIWGKAGEWVMYQHHLPRVEVKVVAPEAVIVKVERSIKVVPDQNQPSWGKGEWWTFKKREVVTMERESYSDRIDQDGWEQNAIDIISGRIQEI